MTPPVDIPADAGRSWWLREALAEEPGEPCSPLAGDTTADVVILGGGYTGMWTAHFIKQLQPGADVVILEQDICGGGPSGRNGGFVNSWWDDLGELCDRFGDDGALALCRAGEDAVAAIGSFCAEHHVDAWYRADGDLGAATSPPQVGEWAGRIAAADRLGVADFFRVLSRDEVRARLDSPVLEGGVLTPFGATVQPARLARGLRRVVLEQGVRIFEGTPVRRFGAGPDPVAETTGGRVRAGAAVIALNAWAARWRRFRRVMVIRASYIVLTAPAPEKLAALGWTNGMGLWNYRAGLDYTRTTPDGRIAFGIGGMRPTLFGAIGPRFAWDDWPIRTAVDHLHRTFPSFADVPLEAAWGGPIDVAGSHLPFFGSFERAKVHFGLGYTGNGVGPSHLGGRILAAKALDAEQDDLRALPIVVERPLRFPPGPLLLPGVLAVNEAIRRWDDLRDRGRRPPRLIELMATMPRRLGYNLGP